jgi:hypothetical protein
VTAGQTPMVLVKAGGPVVFDAECQKALVQCGYDPEAFGTYKQVKAKIDEAKAKVKKWEETPAAQRGSLTPPTADERFLAQCQSGHISQDALYRKASGRDSPCDNHPGAAGNVTGLAPCMPHFGSKGEVGSIHHQVCTSEFNSARACGVPGTPMDAKQIAACSKATIDVSLAGATAPSPTVPAATLLAQAEQLQKSREGQPSSVADPIKDKEQDTRKAGSAAAQQASATSLQSPEKKNVPAPANAEEREDAKKKAAECIEAYRKAGQDAMRQQVVDENSTAKKTEARDKASAAAKKSEAEQKSAQDRAQDAKQRAADAENDRKAAQAKLDAHGPLKRDQTAKDLRAERQAAEDRAKAAEREATQAEREAKTHGAEAERHRAAETEANRRLGAPPGMTGDEKCLQQQADILERQLPNLPPMTGEVPGKRPASAGNASGATEQTE